MSANEQPPIEPLKEAWLSPEFHVTHKETGEQVALRFELYAEGVVIRRLDTGELL